jgi:rod shape-determining protein MreD
MNWVTVLIAGYLLTGLDLGLREGVQLWPTHIVPSLVIPFVVYVALFAPVTGALWTGLLVGLVVDLSTTRGPADSAVVIVGPHAIGFLVMAYFVLTVRTMVIRRNPLTLGALSAIGAAIGYLIAIVVLQIRAWYGDPISFSLTDEVLQRLGSALATGLSGMALSVVLFPMFPVFGFYDQSARRFTRRET